MREAQQTAVIPTRISRFFSLPCLGVLLCLFPLSLAAQNVSDIVGDTFEETAGRGLSIRTRPNGVRVFINGAEQGRTPFSSDALRAGEYNIRLSKDGYRDRRFKIVVPDKSRLVVSIEMEEATGQVLLRVNRAEGSPSGDTLPLKPIFIAGGKETEEPVLTLVIGWKQVQVRAFGWEDASVMVFVREGRTTELNVTLRPEPFRLSGGTVSRRRFNPHNAGTLGSVEFRFEVSAPGSGSLTIRDQGGVTVYTVPLGPFSSRSQQISWNGRDRFGDVLEEGLYTARIEGRAFSGASGKEPPAAGDPDLPAGLESEGEVLDLQTGIDFSASIFPLSFSGGVPGLLFAPVPVVLPRGSFQIEASLLFGRLSLPEESARAGPERAFSSLPFEGGFRFVPLDRLEIGAVVNSNTRFDGGAGWGFTGSAKYAFLGGAGSLPLNMAAAVSYSWAGEGGEAPLGTGRGGGLYLPLSLDLGFVSFLFSPGMRWAGMDDPVPRLLLSAGALFQGPWFIAGVSLRPDFDFTNSGERAGMTPADRVRLLGGAEFKFYPPPSNLVFSLSGGMWLRGGDAGVFGGAAVGILF
ncbi:MAG: PEGA domain-containing protein [Treponema sp.]|nr:PEGA domain-containing protein [Treponema sp.]